mgnify:CR=1 FL=1
MARPKPTKTVRDKHVAFRVSAEEHFKLMDKAQCSGMSVGDFLRSRALQARKRKAREIEVAAPLPGELGLAQQLRKIGVNVNQIAHHCNRFQVPPPADLAPLLAEIRSLLNSAWARSRG